MTRTDGLPVRPVAPSPATRATACGICNWTNSKRTAALGLAGTEPFFGSPDDKLLQWTEDQRRALRKKGDELGVEITSVCLGAFNGDPAVIQAEGREKAVAFIEKTLDFTRDVGASVMLLCTYLQSHPDTEEKKANLLEVVRRIEPYARDRGIRIGLETPLDATELKALAEAAESDHVGVYYDTGNAVSLGFDPVEEIHILGSTMFAIHIKDSVDKLGALHMGDGYVDLAGCMQAIKEIGYDGWLMLETPGDDIEAVKRDIEAVRSYL
jgi:sugar phosphate isomerase/epimerase